MRKKYGFVRYELQPGRKLVTQRRSEKTLLVWHYNRPKQIKNGTEAEAIGVLMYSCTSRCYPKPYGKGLILIQDL